MLNKMNGTRYCKFDQISSHPWFKGFNWNDLVSLDMKPSYLPKIENKNINEKNTQPYINYIESLREWKLKGKAIITSEDENRFFEWFKKF